MTDQEAQELFDSIKIPIYARFGDDAEDRIVGHEPVRPGDFARAVLAQQLPKHIAQALIKAECALSDIAEGEPEESEGDPLEWAEKRAANALACIRPVMRQHGVATSEWPPIPITRT
jgi:hypothetical protein